MSNILCDYWGCSPVKSLFIVLSSFANARGIARLSCVEFDGFIEPNLNNE